MVWLKLAVPILPGRQEAWRRFTQELLGTRQLEYAESRRLLGIHHEQVWIRPTAQVDLAIFCLEAENPHRAIFELALSRLPFDCWYRKQIVELHGLGPTYMRLEPAWELVFEWKEP